MRVLFIGGTGVISTDCTRRAVNAGFDVTLFNRGTTRRGELPGVRIIRGDLHDATAAALRLKDEKFDVVVNWIVFSPDQVLRDINFFNGRIGQYIFISSASAYQTPSAVLPISEATPLANPYWSYSRNKIACEELLFKAWRENGFPVTVVRPSHTYNHTRLPFRGSYSYTLLDRMRRGKKIVIHGDGTSLWVLTHSRDFAAGFTGLLGNTKAVGEAFHITSDKVMTWNEIYDIFADAAGVDKNIEHVASDFIAAFDPEWGASLLGDKSHCLVFDNSKIKSMVPGYSAGTTLEQGAREVVQWFDTHPDAQVVDKKFDRLLDDIIFKHQSAMPSPGRS